MVINIYHVNKINKNDNNSEEENKNIGDNNNEEENKTIGDKGSLGYNILKYYYYLMLLLYI